MRRLIPILLFIVPLSARPQSTDSTLDVVSWNVEWFGSPFAGNGPADKNLQEANVARILKWMNADLYGLVEVVDTMRLRRVVDSMGRADFGFVVSPFCTQATQPSGNAWLNGQKLAFIYRRSVFTNISTRGLMRNSATANTNWATGRFPYMFTATATLEGVSREVNFILIHAKAGSTQSDFQKRLDGVKELKDTLDQHLPTTANIIMGDFNDALHNSIYTGSLTSPYAPIVMDSLDADHYRSITLPIGKSGQSSMTTFPNMIDHHVISNELSPYFVPSSPKVVTDLVSQVPDFITAKNTTDHYPVFSRYDLNMLMPTAVSSMALADAGITYGPNPVVGELVLTTSKTLRNVRFRVLDPSGRTVAEADASVWTAAQPVRVPFTHLPPGQYLLTVGDGRFLAVGRIVR